MDIKDILKPLLKFEGAAFGLLEGGPEGAAAGYELGDKAGGVLDYIDEYQYNRAQERMAEKRRKAIEKQQLLESLHYAQQKLLQDRVNELYPKKDNILLKNIKHPNITDIETPPLAPIIPPYYLPFYGFHEHYKPQYPEIGARIGKPIDIAHPPLTKQPNASMPPAGGFRNHVGFIERKERVSGFSGRIINEY